MPQTLRMNELQMDELAYTHYSSFAVSAEESAEDKTALLYQTEYMLGFGCFCITREVGGSVLVSKVSVDGICSELLLSTN